MKVTNPEAKIGQLLMRLKAMHLLMGHGEKVRCAANDVNVTGVVSIRPDGVSRLPSPVVDVHWPPLVSCQWFDRSQRPGQEMLLSPTINTLRFQVDDVQILWLERTYSGLLSRTCQEIV